MLLRSHAWDGPAPTPGDVLVTDDGRLLVRSVAAGAGIGHYRLDVVPVDDERTTGSLFWWFA